MYNKDIITNVITLEDVRENNRELADKIESSASKVDISKLNGSYIYGNTGSNNNRLGESIDVYVIWKHKEMKQVIDVMNKVNREKGININENTYVAVYVANIPKYENIKMVRDMIKTFGVDGDNGVYMRGNYITNGEFGECIESIE